jgi:hypothetical protein
MAYFDDHPRFFRFLFGLLAAYLFIIAALNFYRYASSTTDENLFDTSPSRLYVIKSFPARLTNYDFTNGGKKQAVADSIQIGDLLMVIGRQRPDSVAGVTKILRALASDSSLTMQVLRPKQNKILIYRVARPAVPDSFLRHIPPTAMVFNVFKGGASERAGLQVGDLIFRINGKTFRHSHEADQILRRGQSGKTIAYDIIRDNRQITLQVKLARFGVRFSQLIFLLCGMIYMAVGAFIAMQRPQFSATRLTGLAMLLIGFFISVIRLQREFEITSFTLTRALTLLACLFIGIAVWFHSSYYFPKERPELLAKHWMPYVPYLFPLIALGVVLAAGPQGGARIFNLALGFTLLSTVIYSAVIQFIYRQPRSAEHKRMSRIIKWTGCLVGVVALALGLALRNYPDFGYIGIPLAFIPLAYLYTIGRYRLFDMDLRVRRNVQYSIASMLWVIFLIILAVKILLVLPTLKLALPNLRFIDNSIEITDSPLPPEERQLLEKGVLMLMAIGLTLAFWQIGRAGQRLIAQKFYRGLFDYRRAASELADVMATKLTMMDLARGIVQKLANLMQLRRAGVLFFRDQKTCCCQEAHGFDGKVWKEFCLNIDQKFIDVLQQFRSESRFSIDYLPHGIKENFQQHRFRHIIPIRFKERLVGVLLIGEKLPRRLL